jgi:hypothetical protein
MAHGLADILAYQAVRIGGTGRRTETAQTTVVAECGNYDRRFSSRIDKTEFHDPPFALQLREYEVHAPADLGEVAGHFRDA